VPLWRNLLPRSFPGDPAVVDLLPMLLRYIAVCALLVPLFPVVWWKALRCLPAMLPHVAVHVGGVVTYRCSLPLLRYVVVVCGYAPFVLTLPTVVTTLVLRC